jgi:hypothetical protein
VLLRALPWALLALLLPEAAAMGLLLLLGAAAEVPLLLLL